ncbi:endonuclease/exonuclease/phosphatase family protein [Labrenzia sp. DG1229]|uniref:endonuclease/exonuclease/phosphatase family protein n=1 Tax=Labrenzia sp. DG1229 TaxID=681847 RepID=UPI000AC36D68|nr:endonuclease/exonuclease/phosphatase family protein [Labrenzia sp. DG1229]
MALHRKVEALLSQKPDIAVVSECARPDILAERGVTDLEACSVLWMGENPHKGLGIFAFNDFTVSRVEPFYPTLRFVLPARVEGPRTFNLLAVWAQNASAGITRKHQSGPLRRALTRYKAFIHSGPTVIGGDWNSNAIWDKPGWRINHMSKVNLLEGMGLSSAYHAIQEEEHGRETIPTHYWRDRRIDGPTYHIDYVFAPLPWLRKVKEFEIGTFDDWIGNGLSDHVPLIIDF